MEQNILNLYDRINEYYAQNFVSHALRTVTENVENFIIVMKMFYLNYNTNTLLWTDFTMYDDDTILERMENFFDNFGRPIDNESTNFKFGFPYDKYFIMSMVIYWILFKYRENDLKNNQILQMFELLYMFRVIDAGFRDSSDINNNNFYIQMFMNTYNFLFELHSIINDNTPVGTIRERQGPMTRRRAPGTCTICLDSFANEGIPIQTSCGHVFHEGCFNELLLSNSNTTNETRCPLCRSGGHVQF